MNNQLSPKRQPVEQRLSIPLHDDQIAVFRLDASLVDGMVDQVDVRREPEISELSPSDGTTRLPHHVLNVATLHGEQTVMPTLEARTTARTYLGQSGVRSL